MNIKPQNRDLKRREVYCDNWKKKKAANLLLLSLKSLNHGFECTLGKPTLQPCLLIILVSLAEALRTKIVGIAEGLVNTRQAISAGHEHLKRTVY